MIRRIYASVTFGLVVLFVAALLGILAKLLGDIMPFVLLAGLIAGVGLFVLDLLTTPSE